MEFETLKLEAQRVDYAGDDGSSSEDELKEVAEELEVLKADTVYHDLYWWLYWIIIMIFPS